MSMKTPQKGPNIKLRQILMLLRTRPEISL